MKVARVSNPERFIRSDPFVVLERISQQARVMFHGDSHLHRFDLVHSDYAKYLDSYSTFFLIMGIMSKGVMRPFVSGSWIRRKR